MSIVTIQLGQCGNQVGCEFFHAVADELQTEDLDFLSGHSFFRPPEDPRAAVKPIARSVLVDMEPKVIASALDSATKSEKWTYSSDRHFSKQSGSGNNWAFGFARQGPSSWDAVGELIRKEVECCDAFGGFLFLQSLAGGTGSGVGAYVTHVLRDEYRSASLVNSVVWPHETGEVAVQSYNALLTLGHLHEESDALLVFENDHLHSICTRLLRISRPSFQQMNRVIADALANAFLPAFPTSVSAPPPTPSPFDIKSRRSSSLDRRSVRAAPPTPQPPQQQQAQPPARLFTDMLSHLCPHPGYKILTTKCIPQMPSSSIAFSTHLWTGLLKHLHQMLVADGVMEENLNWSIQAPSLDCDRRSREYLAINRSVANWLVLRGKDLGSADVSAFANPALYAPWSCSPFALYTNPAAYKKHDKTALLLSNSQSILQPLRRILSKAHTMFQSKAYLYQYEKYGVTEADFEEQFVKMAQAQVNYQTL